MAFIEINEFFWKIYNKRMSLFGREIDERMRKYLRIVQIENLWIKQYIGFQFDLIYFEKFRKIFEKKKKEKRKYEMWIK